jgi:hypothetical protein
LAPVQPDIYNTYIKNKYVYNIIYIYICARVVCFEFASPVKKKGGGGRELLYMINSKARVGRGEEGGLREMR